MNVLRRIEMTRSALGRVLLVAGCLWFLAGASVRADTTINSANRYAYGANVGWVDARADTNNGAVVGEFVCSGYMYGANVGWIHLGDGNPTNGFAYGNTATNDYGVHHDGLGNLRGYAYGANIGWVAFESNGLARVDLLTGALSGYAYGANVGWISLSNQYAYVQTDTIDPGPDTDEDGIPDAWEQMQVGNLTNLGAGVDFDGDGVDDPDEYGADTDPNNDEDYLAILDAVVADGSETSVVMWASESTRFYRLERAEAVSNGADWADSGLGLQLPDPGSTTTRAFADEIVTNRFYRVRAIRPLAE